MKNLSIVILLASIVFAATNVFAEEDARIHNSIIHVKAINLTADGSSVAGDTAFILLYENNKEIDSIEAPVDESGIAVFEYPIGAQHLVAMPHVRHKDLMFSAPTVHLHASPDPIQVQVPVYDVSEDNSSITVGSHHLIIRQVAKNILVTEFMQLKNDTDKAITSAQKDTLNRPQVITIFLPQGYHEFKTLEYFLQDALVMSENSFYDSLAIPPGTYDAKFSYILPITSEEMQISKKISMPTGDVMVFSQLKAGQLTGLGASAGQITMEDGSPAEYFMLAKKASGDQLDITITGLEIDSSKSTMIVIVAVFLLIVPLVLKRLLS